MQISLQNNKTLLLKFPFSKATNETIKRLGASFVAKQWTLPVSRLNRLLALYPDASLKTDVQAAAYAAHWHNLIYDYQCCGLTFYVVNGMAHVRAAANVSPALMSAVNQWPQEAVNAIEQSQYQRKETVIVEPVSFVSGKDDQVIWNSIQGGVKAEQRKAAMMERVKQKKWRGQEKQLSIFDM